MRNHFVENLLALPKVQGFLANMGYFYETTTNSEHFGTTWKKVYMRMCYIQLLECMHIRTTFGCVCVSPKVSKCTIVSRAMGYKDNLRLVCL